MKDWRGVIVVLALAGMVFTLAIIDPELRKPAFAAFLPLLGALSQRSKLDALVSQALGQSLPPPSSPAAERKILVPPLPPPTNLAGTSIAPPAENGNGEKVK